MRILWVIVFVVVLSISGYAAVYYFNRASVQNYNLDNERYNRMVAEENLLKATRKLDAIESEMEKLKQTMATKDEIFAQTETVNSDLRSQLQRLSATQQELESKLKAVTAVKAMPPAAVSAAEAPAQPVTTPSGNM